MWKKLGIVWLLVILSVTAHGREPVKALYVALADHYPGVVAFERYRSQMDRAELSLLQMSSWRLLRSYFRSGRADLAFIISPMALDMFAEQPDFRWVGLIHRNGNALAVNELLATDAELLSLRRDRKPDSRVAEAIRRAAHREGKPVQIGVPSLLATHTVILNKYLKENGISMGLGRGQAKAGDLVEAVTVPPPDSPRFIKSYNSRGEAAAFEQSLPWADVVETGGYGQVAWYSKDVLPSTKGHVECIIIATDEAIRNKPEALAEVIHYIQQAGADIDHARSLGGEPLREMAQLIRRHIPAHTEEAIIQSLDRELDVIHYHDLDVDLEGMRRVMDLALEGGVLQQTVELEQFADTRFSSEADVKHWKEYHLQQESGGEPEEAVRGPLLSNP